MELLKLHHQIYSFQKYINAGKLAHFDVIKQAHDMGFEAIEYIGLPGETTEERHALALQIKEEAAKAESEEAVEGEEAAIDNTYSINVYLIRPMPK